MEIHKLEPETYKGRKFTVHYRTNGYHESGGQIRAFKSNTDGSTGRLK